jgi:hypothetical protein
LSVHLSPGFLRKIVLKTSYFETIFFNIATGRFTTIRAIFLIDELLDHGLELVVVEFVVAEWLFPDNGYKNESIQVRNRKHLRGELEKESV